MHFENLKNCIKRNWIIHSDFECIIDPITKEHEFISGGYLLECKNQKYSKNIQTFYNLEEYTKSLYNELKYIEEIEKIICKILLIIQILIKMNLIIL